jgi:hypothetical protein
VSISGSVVGAIVARKRLEVTRSGSLIGDVRVARLTIQDGATFSGKVSMGAATEAPAKAAEAPVKAAEARPAVPEAKPVTADAKPVVSEPVVKAEAKATAAIVAPPPAAKAPTAPPPAAKAPVAPPAAAKAPTVPPKTQPEKGKPKRR